MIKTRKVADRRSLRFGRMSDLTKDVASLGPPDQIRAIGNWTPAQVVEHVARLIEFSLDGFPRKAPLHLRMLGRFVRGSTLNKPLKPGFRVPGTFKELLPSADTSWESASERLHSCIERIEGGDRMMYPSPVFGHMEHEEWEQLHCRHAEMHFSFLHAGSGESDDATERTEAT